MKKISIILVVLFCLALVSAAIYTEPWNQNQRGGNHNLTEMDWISANYFNGTLTGEVTGSMNWTKLKNYPVACPGSGAITNLSDSVTCSDLWVDVAGDTMTGNLNMSGNNITYVDTILGNGDNVRIGNAGTDSSGLTSDDDLFVSGKLEVDGGVSFDSYVLYNSWNRYEDAANVAFGSGTDAVFEWDTNQNNHALFLGLTGANSTILGTEAQRGGADNFAHAGQPDPTLFIHSSTRSGTATNQWISIAHDQTNGEILTGVGNLYVAPASDIFQIEMNDTGVTCNEANAGGIYYNNDTNKHYGCNVTGWQALY